jgi:biotin carboxylase
VAGVICTLGGQTPLALAQRLKDAGVPVLGTQPEAIELAEHRGAFSEVLERAGLPSPRHGTASSFPQARAVAETIGYPVLVRPSYVLGGRGMEIVYDEQHLSDYIARATEITDEHPVLVDRFLDDAVEIDVDALYDGTDLYLGGVMEHIEEAGIHSGDSACALPPITLGEADIDAVRACTLAIAAGVGVRGLLNVQYALVGDVLYVLEANPRASRTVPFVSKATSVPLAKAAARIAVGATISQLRRGCTAAFRRRRSVAGRRADRGEGGGAAVPPVPHPRGRSRRLAARTGDEVHRRGDGLRRHVRVGLRQEPGRRVRIVADQGHRVREHRQPGQAGRRVPGQAAGRSGLSHRGHHRHRAGVAP